MSFKFCFFAIKEKAIFILKLFPESALLQLEFNKIKELLYNYCYTEIAKKTVQQMSVHTQFSFITKHLNQTNEFKNLINAQANFPNISSVILSKELKLLTLQIRYYCQNNGKKLEIFCKLPKIFLDGLPKKED
jgi:hypothetical protein